MVNKPKVLITFREKSENGGPFVSHLRITQSSLAKKYAFEPLIVPLPSDLRKPKTMKGFVNKIKDADPDIVHFAGLQLEGFLVCVALQLAGVKNTVVAIHGSSMDAMTIHGIKKSILKLFELYTLSHVKFCYGVSNFVSQWSRVTRRKNSFGTIYNLPGPIGIKPHRDDVRAELGFKKEDCILVSTGRITEEKGYGVLLEALLSLNWERLNLKFLLIGDGPYLKTLKKELNFRGLGPRCCFMGYRTADDVGRFLYSGDIYLTATLHETFGNSIVEASAHGLPVLASNTGGIPEIIDEGVNGLLFAVGDSDQLSDLITILAEDKDLRSQMGEAGIKKVTECFSDDLITSRINELYEKCLN